MELTSLVQMKGNKLYSLQNNYIKARKHTSSLVAQTQSALLEVNKVF